MANYKPQHVSYINIGFLQHALKPNQTLKILYDNAAFNGSADGFLDTETNLIYQVPSDKTFYALGIHGIFTVVASGLDISEGDTENAETILKQKFKHGIAGEYTFNALFTIASSKFITYDPDSTRIDWISLVGYEA